MGFNSVSLSSLSLLARKGRAFLSDLCKISHIRDEGDSGAKDPRAINEAFVRFKVGEFACFYFAVVGMCCGIIEYEISYDSDSEHKT